MVHRWIHFHRNLAVAAIELSVGGCVANGVMVSEIVSNVLHEFLYFPDVLREERLSSCNLGKFYEIFFRLL